MAKRIIVNVIPEEVRMALCEDGRLLEVAVERTQSDSMVGNIYKGRVENVLPGMQAAFINIGNGKNAFLYAGDIFPRKSFQRLVAEDNLTVGAEIMIEIVKDAMGTKGPRATTHFSIPGRYVVVMPSVDYVGVSRRIESGEERSRLRALAEKIRPKGMGVIVRTVAEGHSEEELARDFQYLAKLWDALTAKAKRAKAPFLLYRDADLAVRIIRDHVKDDIDEVIIDNAEAHSRMVELAKFISPDLVKKIHLYKAKTEIFSHYAIEDEWNKLADRRVDLKCGGYLIIDRTEALTVIDVNTGRFTGHSNLADTVFRTNMEAAAEIARQLRLRDIGGIIVADFIDMEKAGHKKAILTELEARLKADNTKTNVLGLTELGLVEMTRKKSRQTYESTLYESCPCCGGRGTIQTPATLSISIRRQLRRIAAKRPGAELLVQMHPRVAEEFGDKKAVQAFATEIGTDLTVEAVDGLQAEVFVILEGGKALVRSNAPKKVRKPYSRQDQEDGEGTASDLEPLSEEELAPLLAEQFAMVATQEPVNSLEARLAAMAGSLWEPLLEPDDEELADLTGSGQSAVTETEETGETVGKKPRRRRKSKKMLPPSVTDRLAETVAVAAEVEEPVPAAIDQLEDQAAPEVAPKKPRRRRKTKTATAEASAAETDTAPPESLESAETLTGESVTISEPIAEAEPAKPKRKRRRKKKTSPAEPAVPTGEPAVPTDSEPTDPTAMEPAEELPANDTTEAAAKKTKRRRRKKKKPSTDKSTAEPESPAEPVKADAAAIAAVEPAEASPANDTTEAAAKKPKRRRRKKKPTGAENGEGGEPTAAEPDSADQESTTVTAVDSASTETTEEAAAVKKKRRRRRSNGKKKPADGESALTAEPESSGEPD